MDLFAASLFRLRKCKYAEKHRMHSSLSVYVGSIRSIAPSLESENGKLLGTACGDLTVLRQQMPDMSRYNGKRGTLDKLYLHELKSKKAVSPALI